MHQHTKAVIPNAQISPSTVAFAVGSFITSGAIHLTVPPVNEVLMLLASEEQARDDKPKSARTAYPSGDTSTLVYCKKMLRRNTGDRPVYAPLSDRRDKSEVFECGGNLVRLQSPQTWLRNDSKT